MALFLAVLLAQDAETLLRRLEADDPAERGRAMRELVGRWKDWTDGDLGRLEKAAGGADDLAARSREALERIRLRRRVGDRVVAVRPDAEAILLRGDLEGRVQLLRDAASRLYSKTLEPAEVERLVEFALDVRWGPDVQQVLDAAANLEHPAFSRLLLPHLGSGEPSVRASAAMGLARLRASVHAPKVAALLRDPETDVRVAALHALAELRAKGYTKEAAALLGDKPGRPLAEAVLTYLVRTEAKEQVPAIGRFLERAEGFEEKVDAIEALGRLGAEDQADLLARFLLDRGPGICESALRALGRMRSRRHGDRVAFFLESPEKTVRKEAVEALGLMRRGEKAGAVEALLRDPDEPVRWAAAHALLRIQGAGGRTSMEALLPSGDPWAREAGLRRLGSLGWTDDPSRVVELLSGQGYTVAGGAALALGQMGDRRAVPRLVEMLRDEKIKAHAALALGRLGAADRADALFPLLREPTDYYARFCAGRALAEMADRLTDPAARGKVVAALEEMERSEDGTHDRASRTIASLALARLGRKDGPARLALVRTLRERLATGGSNWPEFAILHLGTLAREHEKEGHRRFTQAVELVRPVETVEEFGGFLGTAGLRLAGVEGVVFRGELYEGSRLSPERALEALLGHDGTEWNPGRLWVSIEGDGVRLLSIDDALARWERRLMKE